MFALFERPEGKVVKLQSEYRNSVKSGWSGSWWAIQTLSDLRRRVSLPTDLEQLVQEIESGRTLPVAPADVADIAAGLRSVFPEELVLAGQFDARLQRERLVVRRRSERLQSVPAGYRAAAAEIQGTSSRFGLNPSRLRVLDIGSGSGYLAFALAGLGADVVGVDIDRVGSVPPGSAHRGWSCWPANAPGTFDFRLAMLPLPFEDECFDLVCSMTAVEHFRSLTAVVDELARVIRAGGLTVHGVEPWFGKRGGHGLGTLDFPWGHARLDSADTERYLRGLRPYEADDAFDYLLNGFQRPPVTLDESYRAFASRFEILDWREVQVGAFDPHRAALTPAVVRDCQRLHPKLKKRDLLTLTYTVVARR